MPEGLCKMWTKHENWHIGPSGPSSLVPICITMVPGCQLEFKNGHHENLLSLIYQLLRDLDTWSWCQNQVVYDEVDLIFRISSADGHLTFENGRPCKYNKICNCHIVWWLRGKLITWAKKVCYLVYGFICPYFHNFF